MKSLGYLAIFLLSAAGMFIGLSRRQQNNDLNSAAGIARATTDQRSWDEKNRRKVDSVFFMEVPSCVRGKQGESTRANASAQAVSSGVQSNPFSE